jgi:hypothetical protein
MKYVLIAAAITFALAAPASAQMASETAKTGAKTGSTMQTEHSKPMASGSMAMSADAGMKDGMAMKPMKKSRKMMAAKPMADKPMADGMMKPDAMKH